MSVALVENADCTLNVNNSDNDSTDSDSVDLSDTSSDYSIDKDLKEIEQEGVEEYLNRRQNEEEKKNKHNIGSVMQR